MHRHSCIHAIRVRHQEIFKDYLLGGDMGVPRDLVLVDPAYHSNVGDHMLTLAELRMMKETFKLPDPQLCHYEQAREFVTRCEEVLARGTNSSEGSSSSVAGKVALWNAGGNWGDLYKGMCHRLGISCLVSSFQSFQNSIDFF